MFTAGASLDTLGGPSDAGLLFGLVVYVGILSPFARRFLCSDTLPGTRFDVSRNTAFVVFYLTMFLVVSTASFTL